MKKRTEEKESDKSHSSQEESFGLRQKIGGLAGPLLFMLLLMMTAPAGLSEEGKNVLAVAIWMAVWWVAQVVPLAVTALLPLVLFPVLGVIPIEDTAKAFADPNVLLLMGGFVLAVTIERWNLHKRIAFLIILLMGIRPDRLVLGFMLATAGLSMWISNTATTIMILPIAVAVIKQIRSILEDQGEGQEKGADRFSVCLLLSIAYAGAIGGAGTLIGTPPNIVFASFASEQLQIDVGFADWFFYALPIVIVFLIITWTYMTRIAFPATFSSAEGGRRYIQEEKESLGSMSPGEKGIAVVFSLVALAWVTRSFLLVHWIPGITDASIAVAGIILTFIYPVDIGSGKFLNSWDTMRTIPWDILILLGGGLSLARGFIDSQLAEWIGMQFQALEGTPTLLLILSIVVMSALLSNIVSNTATTSVMLPVIVTLAASLGLGNPLPLMIAATTAASFAFILPVATPPITIVFGSDYIQLDDLMKHGAIVQAMAIVVISLIVHYWIPIAWSRFM